MYVFGVQFGGPLINTFSDTNSAKTYQIYRLKAKNIIESQMETTVEHEVQTVFYTVRAGFDVHA